MRFSQVDVFSADPLGGNPVAVVHDADDLDEDTLRRFAAWTNLSETTFLLRPTDPRADYRVRILTPSEEFPFAGHPTLGSAQAWLAAGGAPRSSGVVVQECGIGLVEVRRDADRLSFRAPPLLREGPLSCELRDRLLVGLELREDDVLDGAHLDNGPGWVVLRVRDAATVLSVRPDPVVLAGLAVGVVGDHPAGAHPDGDECAVEVRAFVSSPDGGRVDEDPVTGSLNAGIGQWLSDLPSPYVASQGTALGRTGRVHVRRAGGHVWVGGAAHVVVSGNVDL